MATTRASAPAPAPAKRAGRWRRRVTWTAGAMLVAVVLLLALAQIAMRVEPGGMPALRCEPTDWSPCQVVDGRILYVQRVDPDGDGDLHVVLLSRQSVTWPGFTMLKVPAPLRHGMGAGVGRWVRAVGYRFRAQHGEQSIGVARWAIAH